MRGNRSTRTSPATGHRSIPARAGEPTWTRPKSSGAAVYPRACGGTQRGVGDGAVRQGLSPRVRGNPVHAGEDHHRRRSIPARAGEPAGISRPLTWAGVYPRACGGTNGRGGPPVHKDGLSPRVRGNRGHYSGGGVCRGSIPARAGEPRPRGTCRSRRRVYPRACGGTAAQGSLDYFKNGLSPRVRGNPSSPTSCSISSRSIPARAGEPIGQGNPEGRSPVYPRACGGTITGTSSSSSTTGLSPRVRGNHVPDGVSVGARRSIPARAGEPRAPTSPSSSGCGLSPRVRGNPAQVNEVEVRHGSIPARAGEPWTLRTSWKWVRVYPRACGGTAVINFSANVGYGLSPRVRGNLRPRLAGPSRQRSIPARAGEPRMRWQFTCSVGVYPRACGGTPTFATWRCATAGLSPRVRGNRRCPTPGWLP